MQVIKQIHHPAVWLAIILQQAVGAAFYTVLAEPWMQFNQITTEDLNSEATPFIVSFVTRVVFTYFIAWILCKLQSHSMWQAFRIGFLIWLCVILPVILPHYAFAQLSYWLSAIDAGSDLLAILVCVFVLQSWQKSTKIFH